MQEAELAPNVWTSKMEFKEIEEEISGDDYLINEQLYSQIRDKNQTGDLPLMTEVA